jgi:hypothetical protein
MSCQKRTQRGLVFLVLSFFFALALTASSTPTAEARLIVCRGDPIVWLSDNTKIHLIADINIRPRKVVAIDFVVHVPPGTDVTKIRYNKGVIGSKENVQVVADGNPGEIKIESTSTTKLDPVPVQLKVRAIHLGTRHKVFGTAQGETGQTLTLVINQP